MSKVAAWPEELLRRGFWNEHAETMPREQIDASQFAKLQALLRYAYEHSPYYRARWDQLGLQPGDVRSLADFKTKVPLTEKADVLTRQAEAPPYGPSAALESGALAHHSQTSGTTGQPFRIPFGAYDTERYGEPWIYGWWALGVRPSDSFYFAFNFGPYAGFWSAYWGVRRLGAKVISGGGADTEGHVKAILTDCPTVLLATPSYALRIAEQARKMGVDLAGSSIRLVYVTGEPGPFSLDAVRDRLEAEYGAVAGEHLGVAELDAIAFACPGRRGVHLDELNDFSWSRDPVTGVEVGDGEVGEHVITTFVNSAQPLINYNTHDLVRAWRQVIPCGCGRTWAYLDGVVLGRSDQMVTVRGTNVYPTAVENLVYQVPGVSEHFQLVLSHNDSSGMDEVTVRLEPVEVLVGSDRESLALAVANTLHDHIGLRMAVELVEPGALPRSDLKAKRIVDQRPAEVRRELERPGATIR